MGCDSLHVNASSKSDTPVSDRSQEKRTRNSVWGGLGSPNHPKDVKETTNHSHRILLWREVEHALGAVPLLQLPESCASSRALTATWFHRKADISRQEVWCPPKERGLINEKLKKEKHLSVPCTIFKSLLPWNFCYLLQCWVQNGWHKGSLNECLTGWAKWYEHQCLESID